MTALQKILAAALIGALWLGALVAKHFYADIEIGAFIAACVAALSGLGIHTAAFSSASSSDKQGGFARLWLLTLLAAIAAALCLLVGCGTLPTPTQVGQIRIACAADAGLRPSVSILMAIPGLANPEEVLAVNAARGVIDQVCANPEAPFAGGDPYVAVTQATGTLAGVLVQLQTRKAGPK
jgi:hypothetical protein